METLFLIIGPWIVLAVLVVLAGIAFFLHLLVKHTPVDKDEDRAAADRRVRKSMRKSMRGTL